MMTDMKDNPLGMSWHDTAWIPILNPTNVLEYFSERSNPFYDRTCNNEIVKMQRLSIEQLNNMTGLEYMLLHVQEPILYVIRKQHRHSATQAAPIADFYIIAGVVYQAPDLGSVVNSRLLNTVNHLQGAFDECLKYTRYHPSKGYWWEFKDKDPEEATKKKVKTAEPSSIFQRQRVDMLLAELAKSFPPKMQQQQQQQQLQIENSKPQTSTSVEEVAAPKDVKPDLSTLTNNQSSNKQSQGDGGNSAKNSQNQQIKPEKMKPPPEKKPRLA